jgi:alkaline phosphatase D
VEVAASTTTVDVFRHGVASGDPLPNRVIIWTRVTAPGSDPAVVQWTVARDPQLTQVVASGDAVASPASDGTIKVDVAGLDPGSVYYYAFAGLGTVSPVGRTKTTPRPGCERLRIAALSCAKYTAGYFNAYARVADRADVDLVVHLGDYIYEVGNEGPSPGPAIGRKVEPAHEATTLEDYRGRYAHYRLDPDVQSLHQRHPIVATIDDHELVNDAWRGGGEGEEWNEDFWSRREQAALRAWWEWMPVRMADAGDPYRVYRAFDLGDLACLYLLDARTKRDENVREAALDDPRRTRLGSEQLRWLTDGLTSSSAPWKLIGNGVMFGQVHTHALPDAARAPLAEVGLLDKESGGPDPDQWDGYPAERARILRLLRDRGIGNVLFLSGDVHTSWVVELKEDPLSEASPPVAAELVAPSMTSENLDEKTGSPPQWSSAAVTQAITEACPHIHWVDLDGHGYVLLTIDRRAVEAQWYFVDEVRRRAEGESLAAAWRVEAGDARPRPSKS